MDQYDGIHRSQPSPRYFESLSPPPAPPPPPPPSTPSMDVAKRKITVKVTYNAPSTSSRPPSRTSSPRPPSPSKQPISPAEASATFRPKAKINSSATVRRSPSVVSGIAPGTQRAGSPTKLLRAQNGTLTPTFQPRVATATTSTAKATVRPQTPVSAPNTPDVRSKNLAPGSEVGRNAASRARDGSSLHHAMSFSSLQSASQDRNEAPSIRIRSKVSNISSISKPFSTDNTPSSSVPTTPVQIRASKTFDNLSLSSNPTTPAQMRVRSPSNSSSVSQMRHNSQTPPPPLYPITTGSPAANPHRYGQRSPPNQQHTYQGLAITSPDSQPVQHVRPRFNSTAKVNLVSIPPPPVSPPGSTVSFSSMSSRSQSSQGENSLLDPSPLDRRPGSSVTELWTPSDFGSPRSGFAADDTSAPASAVDFRNDEERKVKAEAKSNRKMADLEITNRSLLSINSSLEATKNKQAKEIRELRRKLRESRLILPPRAYREYKSSVEPDEEVAIEEDSEEDSEVEDATEGNGDEIYKRVKHMLEGLIASGRKALETKVEDFLETKGVAKVLTAEEVKFWQNDSQAENDDDNSDADSMSVSRADISISPSTNGDDGDDYDEGGDTSLLSQDTFYKSSGPPIHISEAV